MLQFLPPLPPLPPCLSPPLPHRSEAPVASRGEPGLFMCLHFLRSSRAAHDASRVKPEPSKDFIHFEPSKSRVRDSISEQSRFSSSRKSKAASRTHRNCCSSNLFQAPSPADLYAPSVADEARAIATLTALWIAEETEIALASGIEPPAVRALLEAGFTPSLRKPPPKCCEPDTLPSATLSEQSGKRSASWYRFGRSSAELPKAPRVYPAESSQSNTCCRPNRKASVNGANSCWKPCVSSDSTRGQKTSVRFKPSTRDYHTSSQVVPHFEEIGIQESCSSEQVACEATNCRTWGTDDTPMPQSSSPNINGGEDSETFQSTLTPGRILGCRTRVAPLDRASGSNGSNGIS